MLDFLVAGHARVAKGWGVGGLAPILPMMVSELFQHHSPDLTSTVDTLSECVTLVYYLLISTFQMNFLIVE